MKLSYGFLPAVVALSLSASLVPNVIALERIPPLVLAENYYDKIDLSLYWVSEKYDGARAWWDGKQFITRGGGVYNAPSWFTASMPEQVLDGELWIGRGKFQQLMQTIRDQIPNDDAWREVKYMVFDAPKVTGSFNERQIHLQRILDQASAPWLIQVPQTKVGSQDDLQSWLAQVTEQGGEGLMLQRQDLSYIGGRHDGLLKLKLHSDAEARVLSYVPGKGKYRDMVGSLLVESANGLQFKIGSGLSDKDRQNPPAIGSMVTYRFQGLTQSGKPRFARFLRVRPLE